MENKKTSFHKFMDATNSVKVELALLDNVLKQKDGFEKSAKQAKLMVLAGANNSNDALTFLKNALSIAESYTQKAKELGSDELTKQGETLVSEFKGSIAKWQKIYNDIKSIQL